MNQWYLISKKIHRWLVIIITLLGLTMMISGMLLKFPQIAVILQINLLKMRQLHNFLSSFFGIGLFLMMMTGVYLFIFPYLIKRKSQIQ